MLEHVPHWLGSALKGVRAGADTLAIVEAGVDGVAEIAVRSPAFGDGERMPDRFTADGEGVSPPLFWTGVPGGAACLVLIVEDSDAPTPSPLVHAVVWGLPAADGQLSEGAIVADGPGDASGDVGRNSYLREGWLPPDPPTGHGDHHYTFQLFALAAGSEPGESPGRGDVIAAMRGRVLAAGVLTGIYSRGEPAAVGPIGAPAAA